MSPWTVLWLLREVGQLLEGLLPRSSSDGWRELLEADAFKADREEVDALLKGVDAPALLKAIEALSEQQDQLLAGRKRQELSSAELTAHVALGTLKLILEGRRARISLNPAFAAWLVGQALPALTRAAPYLPPASQPHSLG